MTDRSLRNQWFADMGLSSDIEWSLAVVKERDWNPMRVSGEAFKGIPGLPGGGDELQETSGCTRDSSRYTLFPHL